MGLDIEALRKRLDSFKGQGERTSAFWKPTEGTHKIRIVPLKSCPENPFVEQYFHYNFGGRTYISPITFGNRDPIVEFAEKLRGDGNRESWEQAKPFFPKARTSVPVVVRGEESEGVRFYSFGKTVYEALLSYIADPDYGDITDVHEGRDITVEYISKEKSDTSFPKTIIRVSPKQTPLSEDTSQSEHWLETQPDLSKINKEPTFEELETALRRYLDPDSVEETSDKGDSVTESLTTPSNVESSPVTTPVDEFEQLFNS